MPASTSNISPLTPCNLGWRRWMSQGVFEERGVSSTLLSERAPMEEISLQLDLMLSLSFDSSFSFSLAPHPVQGDATPGIEGSGGERPPFVAEDCERMQRREREDATERHRLLQLPWLLPCPDPTLHHTRRSRNCSRTPTRHRKWPRNLERPRRGTFPRCRSPCWEFTILLRPSSLQRSSVPYLPPVKSTIETGVLYSILSDIGNKYPKVITLG